MCERTEKVEHHLPMDTHSPRYARDLLRAAACQLHDSSVVEDAELLVSELVTNGVRHGGPPIVLRIECIGAIRLKVSVSDGGPKDPAERSSGPDDESGRGLRLVDYISDEWGVDHHASGKTVWFTLVAA